MPYHLLRHISNKREILARALDGLGVIKLLEQIPSRRQSLVVLTYHRIAVPGPIANPYYDPVISATPAGFEAQLRYLAKRFHIIDLQTLIDALDTRPAAQLSSHGSQPLALVTFDDGYQDNYTIALPILRKLGIPAVFFIVSGFLECAPLPWWDHVAYVIKRTRFTHLRLKRAPGDSDLAMVELGPDVNSPQRTGAIRAVIGWFLEGMVKDEAWFLRELGNQAEVPGDSTQLGRELFMDAQQVRQLANAGMVIGSHSVSHRALSALDEQTQSEELGASKLSLEKALGLKVQALAYPFGWAGSFTERTIELAREAGYRLAFSAAEGINRFPCATLDPFALRRLTVGTGDSAVLLRARAALHSTLGRSTL